MKKKLLVVISLVMAFVSLFSVTTAFAAAATESKLPNFTDDFESYTVDGKYVEVGNEFKEKWANNVLSGGESVGMDGDFYEKSKIKYENGTDGNKVLAINNAATNGSFYYIGPKGDYRVKNFTLSVKVKFLTDDVSSGNLELEGDGPGSWFGVSFRKKAQIHYTGTQNLLFIVRRKVDENKVSCEPMVNTGGGAASFSQLAETDQRYTFETTTNAAYQLECAPNTDTEWFKFTLQAENKTYKMFINDTLVVTSGFDSDLFDYFGYLSLNCCTANVLVDDVNLQIDDETMPPVIPPVETPVIAFDAEKPSTIKWDYCDGSGSYELIYTNEKGETKTEIISRNKADLTKYIKKDGTYKITIVALTDDAFEFLNSAPSNELTYVVGNGGSTGGDNGGSAGGEAPSEQAGGCGGAVGVELPVVSCVLGLVALSLVVFKKKEN